MWCTALRAANHRLLGCDGTPFIFDSLRSVFEALQRSNVLREFSSYSRQTRKCISKPLVWTIREFTTSYARGSDLLPAGQRQEARDVQHLRDLLRKAQRATPGEFARRSLEQCARTQLHGDEEREIAGHGRGPQSSEEQVRLFLPGTTTYCPQDSRGTLASKETAAQQRRLKTQKKERWTSEAANFLLTLSGAPPAADRAARAADPCSSAAGARSRASATMLQSYVVVFQTTLSYRKLYLEGAKRERTFSSLSRTRLGSGGQSDSDLINGPRQEGAVVLLVHQLRVYDEKWLRSLFRVRPLVSPKSLVLHNLLPIQLSER